MDFSKNLILFTFVGTSISIISLEWWIQNKYDGFGLQKSVEKAQLSSLESKMLQSQIVLSRSQEKVNRQKFSLQSTKLALSEQEKNRNIALKHVRENIYKISKLGYQISKKYRELLETRKNGIIKEKKLKEIEEAVKQIKESYFYNGQEDKNQSQKKLDEYFKLKQPLFEKIRKIVKQCNSILTLEKKAKLNLEKAYLKIFKVTSYINKLTQLESKKRDKLRVLLLHEQQSKKQFEKDKQILLDFVNK